MTKRYIAQFAHSPNHYVVVDTRDNVVLTEPQPYHEANDEAGKLNNEARLEDLAIAMMLGA
jgi:hypothetical protein